MADRDKWKVGDEVTWTSQARGSHTTKTGTVVEVIAPNVHPALVGCGWARDHESYVVRVDPKPGSNAKPKLYWPVVSRLVSVQQEVAAR